jgi:hypothetical protein
MTDPVHDGSAPAVRIGAVGWDHDAWQGPYYPDDLPPDWRLAYYANEHAAVLVPSRDWTRAGPQAWDRWVEDVPARFRFLLELPRPAAGLAGALQRLEPCARALAERLGGVLAADPVDAAAARDLAASAAVHPLLLRYTAPSELAGDLRRLAEQGALGRWGLPADAAGASGLDVALLRPGVIDDLRTARAILEALERGPGGGCALLAGQPPDPVRLERLRTLAGLMGLA